MFVKDKNFNNTQYTVKFNYNMNIQSQIMRSDVKWFQLNGSICKKLIILTINDESSSLGDRHSSRLLKFEHRALLAPPESGFWVADGRAGQHRF